MLKLTKLSNKFRRRTIRPEYVFSQGTPYAATLASAFDRTAGQLAGGGAITGSKAAIQAGSAMVKAVGETVTLAGATDTERIFGLIDNNVGGDLDDLGDTDMVGIWRGVGSTYRLLAPAFLDTGLATAAAAEDGTDELETYLNPTSKGVLGLASGSPGNPGYTLGFTARLIKRDSANAIVVELLV